MTSPRATAGDAAGIRQMRIALKLSQRQVAALVGVAESTVKRTEKKGRGHNLTRIRDVLADALHKSEPRSAVEHIVTEIDGSPSDLVREFQALLDSMPTIEQQWAAVRTFALTVGRVADARLQRGPTGDAK